jgi:ABC-2 type transport system permease protein
VLSVLVTVAFGSLGLFAALRTGSGEAVQSLFPVFFVFLFLSSMSLPLDLLQVNWFHAVASANPVSYLLQAFRSLLIEGWNGGELALGFGIALAILTVGMVAASASLKTRLVRT